MKRKSKEELLEEILCENVENLSYELFDLTFEKRGKDWFLTLFIDKDGGITLDDCEIVSRSVSDLLDEKDPIEQSYFLEVSSPGLNRPIKKEKNLEKNINKKIEVHLFAPLNGSKDFEGILKSFTNHLIVLELEDNEMIEFERSKIAKLNQLDELNFKHQA
ncbi:MAG: ribosome maturation factor RimP [Eubacteriaceae bacterium]